MEGHEGHMMPGNHDMSSMSGHEGHAMPGHDMPEASCSMNMLFNWQINNVCVVFESWHIHNAVEMLISCIVVFCIAAGYEYLRVWTMTLQDQWSQADKKKLSDQQTLVGGHTEDGYESANVTTTSDSVCFLRKDMILARRSSKHHVLRSIIYAVLVAISFWLMLVFMTYNGYLMIATVLGAGFGHLIFGNGKLNASRDIQCH
ncbi:serine/threonine protein kinase, AGC [Mucor velutinosus]|uniref:Copper transport protein n=1 Tax=Mucor velutinosus TaxID=708070 RepID=A0AAN7DF58_9FUNG|nr:serine/threonine protein kinase, AGC [Mucor velutinosus]